MRPFTGWVDRVSSGMEEKLRRDGSDQPGMNAAPCSLVFIPFGAFGAPSLSYLVMGLLASGLVLWLARKAWVALMKWPNDRVWALAAILFALTASLQTVKVVLLSLQLRQLQQSPSPTPATALAPPAHRAPRRDSPIASRCRSSAF